MSVISVMPDTGLDPTMAMALAATVVKRNEMIKTSSSEMTVKSQLLQYTELEEEEEHRHKYGNQHRQDGLHGQVAFGPLAFPHSFTFELFLTASPSA